MTISMPERVKEKFLEEVLSLYSKGELSAGRATEMLAISRAESMPKKLNRSILKELSTFE